MAKTWQEKYDNGREPVVKTLEKSWLGNPAGSKMLISTPTEISEIINKIPVGKTKTVNEIKKDLAKKHRADFTCPLTTGIFLKIIAELNFEKLQNGEKDITPFWRVIDPTSKLAQKLSFGADFVAQQRDKENSI